MVGGEDVAYRDRSDQPAQPRRRSHVQDLRRPRRPHRGTDGPGQRDQGTRLVALLRRRHPEGFDVYIGLEEAASNISWYESELVPGLLQTERYARALIEADNSGVADEEITRRVQLRIERQTLLTRVTAAPELKVVLNEAIIRRPVGGAEVMAPQIRRLLDASDLQNMALRIMPFSAGLHHGIMSGPFVILRFPLNGDGKATEPPTVYVDGFTGALYLDKPAEIDRYTMAFADIWSAALSEGASQDLLNRAFRELEP
jgi:hypothetical protein